MTRGKIRILTLVLLIISGTVTSQIREDTSHRYLYLSPVPGSQNVNPQHTIALRTGEIYQETTPELIDARIISQKMGLIDGCWYLAAGKKTLIFKPTYEFLPADSITVFVNRSLRNGRLSFADDIEFSFSISPIGSNQYKNLINIVCERYYNWSGEGPDQVSTDSVVSFPTNDTLPDDFHDYWITVWNDPSPGYNFSLPVDYVNRSFYLTIMDNYGTPVYFRETDNGGMDFKVQPEKNILTWWDGYARVFFGMDSKYSVMDTFAMGNGYSTDLHELLVMDNGNYWCLGLDPQIVDMDTVVQGGQKGATVTGLIVQELDSLDNVIFQWRSWDHYAITDCHEWVDLTDSIIDYVHGNSIAFDSDTSLVISCRNMDEITKIDRRTGEMIWRWNGKNDQFEWINDDGKFHVQHSIRYMDNGHYSIFDNGSVFSSAVEYAIDEDAMTATLIKRIRRFPDAHAVFMGNAQRLGNGNTVCGWGNDVNGLTEFDPDGNMLLDISIPNLNYRAFKFPWKTTLFEMDRDTIDFGDVENDTILLQPVALFNNSEKPITFNRIIHHHSPFEIDIEVPFNLLPGADTVFNVRYETDTAGYFFDVITFCTESDTGKYFQRVGSQIYISGSYQYNNGIPGHGKAHVEIFPNPVADLVTIDCDEFIKSVRIYNMEGLEVYRFDHVERKLFFFDCQENSVMRSGIYLLKIITQEGELLINKIVKI